VLPFRKLCTVKYDKMGIPFRFADIPEADIQSAKEMQDRISKFLH